MRSSVFWGVTQCRFIVNYRRFGTTYQSQLQVSSSPKRRMWPKDFSRNGGI